MMLPRRICPRWTAINGIDPDGILWQTSDSGLPSPPYDTAPNAAWVNDPPVISDKYLDAPGVSATESWYVRLTFRHNFNLEASDADPNVGFDGGVLELSMDGGNTFQDITVWGSFESGGLQPYHCDRPRQSDRRASGLERELGRLYHDSSEPIRRAFEMQCCVGGWRAITLARAKAGVLTQLTLFGATSQERPHPRLHQHLRRLQRRHLHRHRGRSRCTRGLQGAGAPDGGPLLEWSYLEQHRHLSQRRADCYCAEPPPGSTPIKSGCVARARTPTASAMQALKTALTRSW
jgi:hypothetical protein